MASRRYWTEAEVEVLHEMYPKHGADVTKWETKIDRTRGAIFDKADKLGLCRYKIDTGIDDGKRVLLAKAFVAICERMKIDVSSALRELNQLKRRRLI